MGEHCVCGNILLAKTAWTDSNPGRRFISCDRCRYFRWIDAPLCERARIIIPGLLRRINNLEAQLNRGGSDGLLMGLNEGLGFSGKTEKEVKKVQLHCGCNTSLSLLILTWIVIFVYYLCKVEDVEDI